ncbi:MAG: SPFH domain-containing protein [Candidatus Hydrogenedentes bacterium]|nr:SPFH domain-containing protein [Candidatus Hydrogenedentota bacterium]
MLGWRFIKVQPTDYVLQYRRGALVREGAGLAFWYFAPTTSLVRVPVGSVDVPFIIQEVTSDFQEVTVQGQLTYRVADARKLAKLMNYTLASNGRAYESEDPQKLPQRLISHAQVLTRSSLKTMSLREALGSSDDLVAALRKGLQDAEVITSLGIEVLGLSILAIKPTPETSRALEAEAREQILRQADEAIYARRNAAVEQERAIKENELNTEIAVENKKRQIREAQMDAQKAVQQKKRELQEAEMAAKIALEERNKELVALATQNTRQEADAKAYGMSAMMKALGETDPRVLQALASVGMEPGQLVAAAFRDLAQSAGKIGQLNVSPDLLRELMDRQTQE